MHTRSFHAVSPFAAIALLFAAVPSLTPFSELFSVAVVVDTTFRNSPLIHTLSLTR
jgi:hypothetical protein